MRERPASAHRQTFFISLCAAAAAIAESWLFFHAHGPFVDFKAFWCAGSVLSHGGDPYAAAPMVRCEYADPAFRPYHSALVAIPAPLPGYALLPFAALAHLPYAVAAMLWLAALVISTVACVILCAKLSGRSLLLCAAAFLLPALALWLPVGEIVPVALAGALLAAYAMRLGRPIIMIVGLVLLALEPHLALGVWIAAALYDRRNIVPIAGVAFALLALWALGADGSPLAYLRTVLPLHAYAELPRDNQYSLSWIAFALGASQHFALTAGTASYALFTGAGVVLGRLLARETRDPFPLIATVLFAEVFGGTFIHDTQTAVAIPAALILSDAALMCLVVPWLLISKEPLILPVTIANCAIVARNLRIPKVTPLMTWCAATILVLVFFTLRIRHMAPPQPLAFPLAGSVFASGPWGAYVWAHYADFGVMSWAVKLPTWTGLILLWIAAAKIAVRAERHSALATAVMIPTVERPVTADPMRR